MIAAIGAGLVSQLQQGLSGQKPGAAASAPPTAPHRPGQAHATRPQPPAETDSTAISASAARAVTAAKSLLLGIQAGGAGGAAPTPGPSASVAPS